MLSVSGIFKGQESNQFFRELWELILIEKAVILE